MSGTKAGGKKAAETNIKRHGKGFYAHIGSIGGSKPTDSPKGFATNLDRAREAGRKGGLNSTRGYSAKRTLHIIRDENKDIQKVFTTVGEVQSYLKYNDRIKRGYTVQSIQATYLEAMQYCDFMRERVKERYKEVYAKVQANARES